MKKWEIGVLVGLFVIIAIFFFFIKQPWEAETSKKVEIIDDVGILPMFVEVSDKLDIVFKSDDKKIVSSENYESGNGWKFVILDIGISNQGDKPATFFAQWLEDENSMAYNPYNLEHKLYAEPYNVVYPYKWFVDISSNSSQVFSIAYKIPLNVIPEKLHYSFNNPDMHSGEIILKK